MEKRLTANADLKTEDINKKDNSEKIGRASCRERV